MNTLLVLRAMILKELRTTLRERQQLIGLVISIIGISTGLAVPAMKMGDSLKKATIHAAQWGILESSGVRWATILIGVAVGIFFTLGYLISAIVVSFASEKESKTLELVLASPISDTLLFVGKCIGVLIPSITLGFAFIVLLAAIGKVLYGGVLEQLPFYWAFYLTILSLPLILLPSLFLVGVGALVSAKAETAKGAGQVLGVVFFVIFFGGGYGIPLLVNVLHLGEPLKQFFKVWFAWPFATQYAAVVLILAIPAVLSLAVGRAMFHRDRLLT